MRPKYDAFSKYHPLTNFLFFIGAIGFSVIIQHPLYLAVGAVAAASYYLLLNGRKGLTLVFGMIPLFLVVALTNPLFNTYGVTPIFHVFGRPYTLEALFYGMALGAMLAVTILWFGCYSAVLTGDKFVCLFGSLIPSLSMLLVMVLRMIPNLMRKAKLLSGARKSIGKGAGEQSTNREKLHDGMSILSALTDWALEGSIVTADSMRARGYGAAKRTSFQLYRLTARDGVLIAVMLILALLTLLPGGTGASYTPECTVEAPTGGLAAYFLYLILPCAIHLKEAVQWHSSISKI